MNCESYRALTVEGEASQFVRPDSPVAWDRR